MITGSSPLIANEKDAKVVHPKSLAGRVGGRVLEARLLGYGSIHCAAEVRNLLQSGEEHGMKRGLSIASRCLFRREAANTSKSVTLRKLYEGPFPSPLTGLVSSHSGFRSRENRWPQSFQAAIRPQRQLPVEHVRTDCRGWMI